MRDRERMQIEELASIMLGKDYDDIVNNDKEQELHSAISDNYGVDFDNFAKIVWDLLDWTPALPHKDIDGKVSYSHVFGAYLDSTTGKTAFLAIVSKKAEDK